MSEYSGSLPIIRGKVVSMWKVVRSTNGTESDVTDGLSWAEAFAAYEPEAKKFNAVDKDGNYKFPNIRVSIRKVSA